MSRPLIVVGDKTSHGGVVVEGTAMTDAEGKPISCVGHKVTCPRRGHGTNSIATGDNTLIIDGKPAARHGDMTACGATLISSQFATNSDPEGGAAGGASSSAAGAPSQNKSRQFDDKFQLLHDDTGLPLRQTEYAIKRATGAIEHGVTDDEGRTHLLSSTADSESVDIYV